MENENIVLNDLAIKWLKSGVNHHLYYKNGQLFCDRWYRKPLNKQNVDSSFLYWVNHLFKKI